MKKKKILIILIFILGLNLQSNAQSGKTIYGSVLDDETNEKLIFSSISIKNTLIGTVSNRFGDYNFYIPKQYFNDTLIINYIGYNDKEILIDTINLFSNILLSKKVETLDEIVLTPISPEFYIKKAVIKIPDNYPNNSYISNSYFSNYTKINNKEISFHEMFFKTHHHPVKDSLSHMLQLYKKNQIDEDYYDSIKNEIPDVERQFLTPDFILELGKISSKEIYLDSLKFKQIFYKSNDKFNINNYRYINFVTTKKINNLILNGEIIIEKNSDAIVGINYEGNIIIPLKIKPILFLSGYKVSDPKILLKKGYRMLNNKWYVSFIEVNLNLTVERKHFFKENKIYNCEFYQVFNVNNLQVENIETIDKNKKFNINKEIDLQIFNDANLTWEEVNSLKN
ncbi:MAG: hypothetical protein CMD07_01885 [Flavobacteriales bacterium]|nr:hypothetical protein [Flavobacteriales bacterium]|tara:strand:+ start:882 stop:2069 length:1188 start_codon:yes stop_codon:yes gene_type:complete